MSTRRKEKLQEIIQRATIDMDFRRHLVNMAHEVLIEEGFSIPPEKKVVILESTDDLFYVVLPAFKQEKKSDVIPFDFKIENDVVFIKGRLDSYNVGQIRETLLKWKGNLVLDLRDLSYVSSAGLALFLAVRKQLEQLGYRMRLLCLQPAVRNVFILAGFDKIFNI
jgi:anti-sigma B factor antagonist